MEKLLVFIPAYNCEKQVTRVLSQLLDQRIAPWVGECIVVNNRSTDGTEAAVTEHIKNIRAKLRAVGLAPIETVWGIGYKWKSED